MFNRNPYLEKKPRTGVNYKLWSLHIGSIVTRHGFQLKGVEGGPFEIMDHCGSHSICKTEWGFEFDLDSSFSVEFITRSYVNQT